jgi:hypothetical protein
VAERWRGGCESTWAVPVGVCTTLAALAGTASVIASGGSSSAVWDAVFAVVIIPCGLLPFAFRRIDVTVDDEALRVRYSLPRTRVVPRSDISDAAAEPDLRPLQWGGWGYRFLGRRGAAIVLRRGPALVVTRASGRRLAITVDDPEGAVRALDR